MPAHQTRLEVMQCLEQDIPAALEKYLKHPVTHWQPADLLPDPTSDGFIEEVREIRELAKDFDDAFWVVLVGDTITEEALPTYESKLMAMIGVDQEQDGRGDNALARWARAWTAEENRHGDVLRTYLYLSGRVNMREVDISTQYLIADGFDIGTARDPYKNFVYTSFQELATYISHNNVAKAARATGNTRLEKINHVIARDEIRHHMAYADFVRKIFECDPSEMMLAYQHMMKHKIVMPAMQLRESGGKPGAAFDEYAAVAQQIGVYTAYDYIDILEKLNQNWNIAQMNGLTPEAEAARDYLLKLPARMRRVAERRKLPATGHTFRWLLPAA